VLLMLHNLVAALTEPHHVPAGSALWLVTSIDPPNGVRQFDKLRDALNSVRPVLA
jgi:hypothetical protein